MSKKSLKFSASDIVFSGAAMLDVRNTDGRAAVMPRMSFYHRADLAASILPDATVGVHVERYTAGGPPVDMYYSLNDTDQSSIDPTSMAVTVRRPDGTTATKHTKLENGRVTPAMMGAPYDGSTDDAPFIQMALTYFGSVFADAKKYNALLRTPIKMADHQTIDVRGGGWWYVDTDDAGCFTNSTGADPYGDHSSVIQAYGARTGLDVPLQDITIRGVKLDHKIRVDGRLLIGVSIINVKDFVIADCEMTGWAAGAFININSGSGKVQITDNWLHDTYSNYNWASNTDAQMNGIAFDGDRVFGKSTLFAVVERNRISTFVKGATAITAGAGYQCDGISVGAAGIPTYHRLCNNFIDAVDEAIDCSSSWNLIACNMISQPTGAGVKMPHGASENLVTGNEIKGARLWCFALGASTAGSVLNNKIIGNKCYMETGGALGTPAYIIISDNTSTYICSGNVFENNTFDCDGNVQYYIDCRTRYGKNYSIGDRIIRDPTDGIGFVHYSQADDLQPALERSFEIIRPVNKTRARVKLGTSFTKDGTGTEEVIPFNTVLWDDRSEFNTSTHKFTCKMPGWYRIKADLIGTSWPANNLASLTFFGINTDQGGTFRIQQWDKTWTSANSRDQVAFETDIYLGYGTQIWLTLGFNSGASTVLVPGSYLEVEKL